MNDRNEKSDNAGYPKDQVEHLLNQVQLLRNAQPRIQIDLSVLAEQLTVKRAKTYANEALGRRLPVIEQTVLNIFDIYPPNRSEFLTKSECTDIAIQFTHLPSMYMLCLIMLHGYQCYRLAEI